MSKDEGVPEVEAYEWNLNSYELLKRNTLNLMYPRVWSPNKIFQSNTRAK